MCLRKKKKLQTNKEKKNEIEQKYELPYVRVNSLGLQFYSMGIVKGKARDKQREELKLRLKMA